VACPHILIVGALIIDESAGPFAETNESLDWPFSFAALLSFERHAIAFLLAKDRRPLPRQRGNTGGVSEWLAVCRSIS